MKHTEGPWEIVPNITPPNIFARDNAAMIMKDSAPVCIITDNWLKDGMNEANAKLIAAAPELLKALKALLDGCNPRAHNVSGGWENLTNYIGSISIPNDEEVLNAIKAYKKATE